MESNKDYRELLHSNEKAQYGENYNAHLLEQYKIYVEMADRISTRRQSANSYFLTINTAIIAMISYLKLESSISEGYLFYFLVSVAGMILCYTWYRLIQSYKGLNSGKFKIIHELEKKLPTAPFDAEWKCLGEGKNSDLYHPFTHVEMVVPWIFFVLHLFVALQAIILKITSHLVA